MLFLEWSIGAIDEFITPLLWSIDSCQNKIPLTSITWLYRGLRCRPIEVKCFFVVIRWQGTGSQMIAGSSLIFLKIPMKYVVFMCRTIKILTSNWPRTRKFNQLLQAGKTIAFDFDFFSPCSRVDHALHPIFMLWLVKIWQVGSCGKFMQDLESCLLWQLKLTEFCVNLWCF